MMAGFFRLFVVFGILFAIGYGVYRFIKMINDTHKVLERDAKLKAAHDNAVKNKPNPPKPNYDERTKFNYEKNTAVTTFRIAGVTFKDGKYSRQAALKKLRGNVPPMNEPVNFTFEEYEYEGKPAVMIICNTRILGNVPANLVDDFLKLKRESKSMKVKYKVLGGIDISYGCELKITWRF